jgi:hypothetical protein
LLLLRVRQRHAAKGQPCAAAAADSGARLFSATSASACALILCECDAGSKNAEHGDECVHTKMIHLGYLRPSVGRLIHWTVGDVAAVGRRCDKSMARLGGLGGLSCLGETTGQRLISYV